MSRPYQNPFHLTDPDERDFSFGRAEELKTLDQYLHPIYVADPSCLSVVAERGLGGKAIVRQFIRQRRDELAFRIIECDLKRDLGKGDSAAAFYRALVDLVWRKLEALPPQAFRLAERLSKNQSGELYDINDDFWEFFEIVREYDFSRPLLLVFYSFDRLTRHFSFESLDWTWLRELHNNPKTCLNYLLVSRRPLAHIETLFGLERSLFSTLFSPILRIGLLSEEAARSLVNEPASSILQQPPWPDWLEQNILYWGGRNPFCLEQICFHLFSQIWHRQTSYTPADGLALGREMKKHLIPYFNRLFANLASDGFVEPLVQAVEAVPSTTGHDQVRRLTDLGYFLSELVDKKQYLLFSPLFHQYLVDQEVLKIPRPLVVESQAPSQETMTSPDQSGLLTKRQQDVLSGLADGLTYQQIARKLQIEKSTVESYIKEIYSKFDVSNRTEAVNEGRKLGYLE